MIRIIISKRIFTKNFEGIKLIFFKFGGKSPIAKVVPPEKAVY